MSVCALWTVQRSLFNIWQWEEALQWQMCFVVSGDVELWGAEPLSCEQSCAAALGCPVLPCTRGVMRKSLFHCC